MTLSAYETFWYASVQILKKSQTEKDITHFHMLKKSAYLFTLDIIFLCITEFRPYYFFVCNIRMDKNISFSCVTNVRTLHIYFIIRFFNDCELRIENSVTTVTVQHREACRVMPNSYPEWRNFQFSPNNHYGFFFLHTLPSTIAFRLGCP